MKNTRKPRILFYDVENSANEAYSWPGRMYDVNLVKIKKPYQLLSFAYQWEGERKIHVVTREGQKSDAKLVRKLAKLINQADLVVTHNGVESDHKKTRTRMLVHGVTPLKPLTDVDTLKVARSQFLFNGNSLGDLAVFLGVGRKLKHPGFDMWTGCDEDDDARSWRFMARYNKHDVRLLRGLYTILRPWILNHPNVARILDPGAPIESCPNCGGVRVHKRGFKYNAASVKREWHCQNPKCGSRFTTRLSAEDRKLFTPTKLRVKS